MEKEKFMYILEKGYWTQTDLKKKAMKAAYDEVVKHDRKIVYPNEIDDVIEEIYRSVTLAVNNSKGIKMPSIYIYGSLGFNEPKTKKKILMEERILIEAKKLSVRRCNPGF